MSNEATSILIVVLFFGGLIALIVFLFRYVRKVNKRKTMAYANLALELNCSHGTQRHLAATLNQLEGKRHGHSFMIYEKIVGSGKSQVLYSITSFMPSPFPFEFSIGKEGFFNKIGKAIGMKDIEFGNEEFDKTFLLKSKSEDEFRSLMNYKVQGELTRIAPDLRGSIVSKNGEFQYTITGGLTKEKQFEAHRKVLTFMELLIQEYER